MVGERLRVPDGQAADSAVLLRLPVRGLSTAEAIFATGLTDEEIAGRLSATLLVPTRASVVRMWREGTIPAPDDQVVEILTSFIPQLPPAAARRAS